MTDRKFTVSKLTRRELIARSAPLALGTSSFALGLMSVSSPVLAQADTFRVGWIRAMTGPLASTFEGYYYAADIALEEINNAGGILGRKVVKVEVDDQGSPANEPLAMRKLADDGVKFVLGPVGSSQALAAFEVGSGRKMLQSTYATADEVGDGTRFPYHYESASPGNAQVQRHVEYLVALGVKKVGILTEDSAAGASVRASIQKEVPARGLTIVSDQVFPLRTSDMTPFLRKLRNDGAEALDTHLSNLNDMTQFRVGLERLGWKPIIVGGAGLLLTAGTSTLQKLHNDVYAATYRALTYTDKVQPPKRVQEFVGKLMRRDVPASVMAAAVTSPFYDFLHSLKFAIEKSKSFDPDAVKAVFDSGIDLNGLFGRLTFSPTRHFGYSADVMAMAIVNSDDEQLSKDSKGVFRRLGPAIQ